METYSNILEAPTLIIERPLAILDEGLDAIYLDSLCDTVLSSVDDLLHSYGVVSTKTTLKVSPKQVVLQLHLKAGLWETERLFSATRANHPTRTLCAKILRFIQAHNLELN